MKVSTTATYRTLAGLMLVALTALGAAVPSAADAQCVPPNLTSGDVTCKIGEVCNLSIDLDTGGESVASAAAELSSSPPITCDATCSVGADASGICQINPANCSWNVTDFSLSPFDDGEVAVLGISCSTPGSFPLDLSNVSLGRTSGLPLASCGVSGTLTCVECESDTDCTGDDTCSGSGVCVECASAADCNDGNACTIDSCDAGTCVNDAAAANGDSCDDGLFCTDTDTCSAGSCVGAGDPCPGTQCNASCNEATDSCFDTAGTSCSDGDLCTTGDQCDGSGSCVATPTDCSAFDDACNVGVCNAGSGSCEASPLGAGTSCSDGVFCNGAETCDGSGSCQSGSAPTCDDGISCTVDSCNVGSDSCVNSPNNGLCSNGAFCDGEETCSATLGCQSGTPVDCSDPHACTIDSCNEVTDSCERTTNDALCDDNLFCNGTETCTLSGCQDGTAPNCADSVACTDDSCNEATDSCVNATNDDNCDNGSFCDGAETCSATLGCQAGSAPDCDDGIGCTTDSCNEGSDQCDHEPVDSVCDDGTFCNGAEVCDAGSGCESGAAPTCNDGIACTNDSCNAGSDACVNTPVDSRCDDDLFCNGEETCNASSGCEGGTPIDCSDGVSCTVDTCNESADSCSNTADDDRCDNDVFCDGAETCNATLGCQSGTAPSCDDGVSCTADSCDAGSDACLNAPQDNVCDDGTFCNGSETCNAASGCESGTAPDCDDGIACTTDTCDAGSDSCTATPVDALCDDGTFCNGSETCNAASGCESGTAPDCDDGIACTTDTCEAGSDSCAATPVDSLCDDGAFCNGAEVCNSATGCEDGAPPSCDDGIGCTTDFCDETADACDVMPDDTVCDDGAFCNGAETCDETTGCQDGTAPDCDDGIGCTTDGCDEAADACTNDPSDAACDDGEFCNGSETCDPALDCRAGPFPCSDGVACTVDSCDELGDTCGHAASDASCDDGLTCNGAESCDETLGCVSENPPDCGDLDGPCVVGVCSDVMAGCEAMPLPDESSCEDGNACTTVDTCSEGECVRETFCGVPATRGDKPVVSDALFTLRASVALEQCPLCECDVNADGNFTVTDALTVLQATVDIPVELACFVPVEAQKSGVQPVQEDGSSGSSGAAEDGTPEASAY